MKIGTLHEGRRVGVSINGGAFAVNDTTVELKAKKRGFHGESRKCIKAHADGTTNYEQRCLTSRAIDGLEAFLTSLPFTMQTAIDRRSIFRPFIMIEYNRARRRYALLFSDENCV
jgi:hypothetical protein